MLQRTVGTKLNVRRFSSSVLGVNRNLVQVVNDRKTGFSIVSLNRPPINSLNLELLKALSTTLDDVKRYRSRGIILSSTSSNVFSAGLDVMEMYEPVNERITDYIRTLQDVWMKLYAAPFPTACAIHGHSPGGGCLLAVSCEYRVMVENFSIGFYETQQGLAAPSFAKDSLVNIIGKEKAEQSLLCGKLFSVDKSKSIGLINAVALNKEEAIEKCSAWLDKLKRPYMQSSPRVQTVKNFEKRREKDADDYLAFIKSPKVQEIIEKHIIANMTMSRRRIECN